MQAEIYEFVFNILAFIGFVVCGLGTYVAYKMLRGDITFQRVDQTGDDNADET